MNHFIRFYSLMKCYKITQEHSVLGSGSIALYKISMALDAYFWFHDLLLLKILELEHFELRCVA